MERKLSQLHGEPVGVAKVEIKASGWTNAMEQVVVSGTFLAIFWLWAWIWSWCESGGKSWVVTWVSQSSILNPLPLHHPKMANHQHFLFLFVFQLTVIQLSATPITPPHHHSRTCLHPCRDAAARARIETNYTVDAPINEQCYWRFRSSDEMLTGCLNNRWLVFVGDSEIDRETATAAGQPFALYTKGYRTSSVEILDPEYYFNEYSKLIDIVNLNNKQ